MLMDIKCSTVVSVKVELKFDSGCIKERTISVGDVIDVDFNSNGLRRKAVGKVLKIYAEGSDPKTWMIVIDSSDDFQSIQYRFSPMNILDVEILRKIEATQFIEATNDYTNIKALRVVKGRLQYTQDGLNWYPINIDRRDIIKDEEGTEPYRERHIHKEFDDDVIRDEEQ